MEIISKSYLSLLVINTFLCFSKEFGYLENYHEVNFFLDKLENKFHSVIPKDNKFLMKISNIMKIGKFKAEVNLLKNYKVYKLDKKYQQYYEEINSIIKKEIPKFCGEDILYLTVLIKDAVDSFKLKNEKYKKVIIIDNSFEYMFGKLLLKYLKNNYWIDILKIIPSYELTKNLNIEFDYIILLNEIDVGDLVTSVIKISNENILKGDYDLEKYDILKK
ncbi:MAG: hypothetical protein ACRC3I_12100 [Cetobacterium sp.]